MTERCPSSFLREPFLASANAERPRRGGCGSCALMSHQTRPVHSTPRCRVCGVRGCGYRSTPTCSSHQRCLHPQLSNWRAFSATSRLLSHPRDSSRRQALRGIQMLGRRTPELLLLHPLQRPGRVCPRGRCDHRQLPSLS